jgi:hypothetical protein
MSLRIVLVVLVLAPAVGCTRMRENLGIPRDTGKTGTPIGKVSADDLVAYLNSQADRLQAITYEDVTVSVKEGWKMLPPLRGNLAAAQPRNFRMVAAGGAMATKADMGSNDNLFWLALRVPTQDPLFVYASHSDFESGKASLPRSMPFEPEWVMQALGMTKFPTGEQYRVDVDPRARTYILSWPSRTPSGIEVRKEVVFAVDDADASRHQPQVRKHIIRDDRNNVVCSAEVKTAQTVAAGGTDPHTSRPYVLQYPTSVVLRWEEQRFEMSLSLKGARVNQQMEPEDMRRLFSLPNPAGSNPINLAEARFETPRR